MTNDASFEQKSPAELERFAENVSKVGDLSNRLVRALATKTSHNPALDGPDQSVFVEGAAAYWAQAMRDPSKLFGDQMGYLAASAMNLADMQRNWFPARAVSEDVGTTDKRFSNHLWSENPLLRYIQKQYLTNTKAVTEAVESIETLDKKEKQRLGHFTQQIVDLMSPTNFLPTNPDALERAFETDGESLVQGLENLVGDLEANDGELLVRLADESAFEIGGNVATTPGDVVLRTKMMELIQFRPTTEKVHETPLVIFPPWINKYYILDLKEKNSLIKWITDQGYTLFVVSWVNPDESHADVGLEDYIEDGYLPALEAVKSICDVDEANVVGYCIAGTTLSLALSFLKQRGDTSVKSATFFTTLTDFSDQGEFTPFLQDDFIDAIEDEVKEHGLLRSFIMGRTFSFLRAQDLVYGPAVRSYLLGDAPPAFDLLYWNGDGTNLPAKMSVQYLRGLCQSNAFAESGFELMDQTLRLSDVDVPLFAVTCESDHIAAWKDCYRGVQAMGSKEREFIVSESGHIAGIVNPPSKKKYGHYVCDDFSLDADEWFAKSDRQEGSWWPRWEIWLRQRSGEKLPARRAGNAAYPIICSAPGTYATKRANA